MNRIAQKKLGRGIAYAIASGLGLLLTMSVAGCALEAGTGDEGVPSSTEGTAGSINGAPPAPPVLAHVSTGTNSQPALRAGSAPAGGGQDPQPSPWIGLGATGGAGAGAEGDPNSPIDRQQMGTTVEHK
jgi:hypothetical protein